MANSTSTVKSPLTTGLLCLAAVGIGIGCVYMGRRFFQKRERSEIQAVDELFQKLLIGLKSKESMTTIVRTSEGKSAPTFLCSLKERDKLTYFILKLLRSQRAVAHEMAGNAMVNAFLLKAPDCQKSTVKLDEQQERLIVDSSGTPRKERLAGCTPLFMERVDGINFEQLFLTGRFTEIQDWTSIQEKMGEVSVVDLYMGNNDRFFSTQAKKFALFVNFGNVMFGKMPNGAIEELIFIDNPTYNEIAKIDTISLKEKQEEIRALALPPLIRERRLAVLAAQSMGDEYVPEHVANLNALFAGVMDGTRRKEFSDTITQGLTEKAEQLQRLGDEEASDDLIPFKKQIQLNIERGVDRGIQKLKTGLIPSVPRELESSLSPAFLLLLRKNRGAI